MKQTNKVDSLRDQLMQSMAEMQGIIDRGETFDGNGRLPVSTWSVDAPKAYDAQRVRQTRALLKVSQPFFAEIVGVSAVLVKSWERGVRTPSLLARRLLDEIRANPARFRSLVRRTVTKPAKRARGEKAA